MRVHLVYCFLGVLTIGFSWSSLQAAEPASTATMSVFRKEIDSTLKQEIEQAVASIQRAFSPLEPSQAESFQNYLNDPTEEKSGWKNETIALIDSLGRRTIPLIEEALRNPQTYVRQNALAALARLVKYRETRDEEYLQFEKNTIIPLGLRSLEDTVLEVRARAVIYLGGIARQQDYFNPNKVVDPRILTALQEVLHTEHPGLRYNAAFYLHKSGHDEGIPPDLLEQVRMILD